MNGFKKVSDQGKADTGRTESGRVDESTHQGAEVSEDDYVKNHPDYKAVYEHGAEVFHSWQDKINDYVINIFLIGMRKQRRKTLCS